MLNGYIQSFKNCCCGHGFVVILDIVGNCRQMWPMLSQLQWWTPLKPLNIVGEIADANVF